MRPLRIYLKNFMNHRLTEIDCTNFQSVLVVGKNKKNDRISNGVGKTTIFRAIEYALFNQSHATTLDKIVRDGKKKAVVEFDFELGGDIYRIYRHRTATGSADVRFYKKIGDEFESISERTPTATDILIKSKIKITHKAFTYSVLFRQADLTGITSVEDPKKRKEVLKEPLNLSTYTKLEEMAVDRRRPLKRKIDSIEGSISVIGDPEVDIKKAEVDLVDTIESIEKHKAQVLAAEGSLKQKTLSIEDLKQSLGQQDIDIHKKVSEKEQLLKKLKENTRAHDARLLDLSNRIKAREKSLADSEIQIESDQKRLDTLTTERTVDIKDLQEKFEKVCRDEVKGSELLAGVRAQMNMVKKSLPDSDECPACHQSITPEYRQKMSDDVNEKIKKHQNDIDFFEDALGKCRRKKARLDITIRSERERSSQIDQLDIKIKNTKQNQKSWMEDIDGLYSDQKDVSKKLNADENQIKEISEYLETLKEAASKSDAPAINDKIFKINQEINRIQEEITELNNRVTSLSSVRGGLEERISTRKKDKDKLAELLDELKKVKRELKISQMVVDAFSNRGIPSFIIQTILDELQYEANTSLKELRPELDVQIDPDLKFTYRRNGVERDYAQLSHGQHVYIALAFKRGMARVIQKRLGIDIRILEFDEVDSHLDEAGVDAFADAIRKWQNDFTIFVITHNKDLKDKFSHAILVEEGDDGAQAQLVVSW